MTNVRTLPHRQAAHFRVICAGMSALILTVGLARFAYTPLLPVMRSQAGLSAMAGGWLATCNYMGYMGGALIVAAISNLRWKYQLYRLGLVVAVLSTAAMGLTHDLTLWALLRIVSGASSTGGLLLASGLILHWLMRHGRQATLGLHFTGLGLGIVISGLAAAAMASQLDWHAQWLVLGLLGIAFFLPAWCWLPAPHDTVAKSAAAPASSTPSRRWVWLFMGAYFCAGFGYVISATFIVAILEKLPSLAQRGGWVWVTVGLAALGSSFLWDRVARSLGAIRALMLAYGLQIVSILLPAVSLGLFLNLLSAVLYGGTFVGIVSLTLTLVGRYFPQNPAKAMARFTLSYGVAQMVAPLMAGMMAGASGSYRGALLVTAAVMFLGMLLLQALQRTEPH